MLGDTLAATRTSLEVERSARQRSDSRLAAVEEELKKAQEASQAAEEARRTAEEARKTLDETCTRLEALRVREAEEHELALGSAVLDYKRSEVFEEDARGFLAEHMDELFDEWATTPEGRDRIGIEGLLMTDMGRYTMQRDIYATLRRRDGTFDPVTWGLPEVLGNPDPEAGAEVAVGAEPVQLMNTAAVERRSDSHSRVNHSFPYTVC